MIDALLEVPKDIDIVALQEAKWPATQQKGTAAIRLGAQWCCWHTPSTSRARGHRHRDQEQPGQGGLLELALETCCGSGHPHSARKKHWEGIFLPYYTS